MCVFELLVELLFGRGVVEDVAGDSISCNAGVSYNEIYNIRKLVAEQKKREIISYIRNSYAATSVQYQKKKDRKDFLKADQFLGGLGVLEA